MSNSTIILLIITPFVGLGMYGLTKTTYYKEEIKPRINVIRGHVYEKGKRGAYYMLEELKKNFTQIGKGNVFETVKEILIHIRNYNSFEKLKKIFVNIRNHKRLDELEKEELHVFMKRTSVFAYVCHLVGIKYAISNFKTSCLATFAGLCVMFFAYISIVGMMFFDKDYKTYEKNKRLVSFAIMELYVVFFIDLAFFGQAGEDGYFC